MTPPNHSGETEPTLAVALALLDEYLGMVPGYHADMLADAHVVLGGGQR